MATSETSKYTIPKHILDYIEAEGYACPWSQMEGLINTWDALLRSKGDFWDSTEEANGVTYKRHRMTVRPFQAVADEYADLIFGDEGTSVTADDEKTNAWLQEYIDDCDFLGMAQDTVSDAFGLGTAAWAMHVDTSAKEATIRAYDATMILPLSWDNGTVTECAFCTKTVDAGKVYDQLSMHVRGEGGAYRISTAMWDAKGIRYRPEWLIEDLDTGCPTPTFAIVRPAIPNKHYKFSPYGVPVFDGHEDVLQSVDQAYDAIFGDLRKGEMRMFLSDQLIEVRKGKDGKAAEFPFGKDDVEFFHMLDADGDLVKEYAPTLRTAQQKDAYELACAEMGKACGFGENYWTVDKGGQLKTATEVVTGNSKLMRTVRRHERKLAKAVTQIMAAAIWTNAKYCDAKVSTAARVGVIFDDSVITDTATEKTQDMAEVSAGIMSPWEYRARWYGEDEDTAKANVPAGATEPEPFFEE